MPRNIFEHEGFMLRQSRTHGSRGLRHAKHVLTILGKKQKKNRKKREKNMWGKSKLNSQLAQY
jgi:hypothetical protein